MYIAWGTIGTKVRVKLDHPFISHLVCCVANSFASTTYIFTNASGDSKVPYS